MAYQPNLGQLPAPETFALTTTNGPAEPELIRRQIDHTRNQMEMTISEIGERLSPDNLIAQAKTTAREATVGRIKDMTNQANRRMEEVSDGLGQTIRDNPLPVALISMGLGWLWLAGRNKNGNGHYYRQTTRYYDRDDSYRYLDDDRGRMDDAREWAEDVAGAAERKVGEIRDRAEDVAGAAERKVGELRHRAEDAVEATERKATQLKNRAGETVQDIGESVGETAEAIQERLSDTATRTRQEAQRLSHRAQQTGRQAVDTTTRSFRHNMEESPLLVGAVALVAGVIVGASLPATDVEDNLLGETRDRLFDEAKVRAQDAVERVQAVIDDTQHAAMNEVKIAAERHNLNASSILENEEDNGNAAF